MEQEILTSGSGKNKKYLIIGGAVILVLVFGSWLGYGFFSKKAGEQIAENFLEGQLGGDVNISSGGDSATIKTDQGSLSLGDAAKWPSDMPSDIPEFTAGKLVMAGTALTGGKGWQVVAENVDKSDFTDYQSALEAKGWKSIGMVDATIGMIQMTKDKMTLIASYNSEDNSFTLAVAIEE